MNPTVMDLVREIEEGLKKPGKSRQGLAKALNRSPSAVTEMLRKKGKRRKITAEEIPLIREYLELEPTVRVVGSVGASSDDVYFGEASDDPAETVPAPAGATSDMVAVEIKGTSLGAGLNGWLAFYKDRREPVTADLHNRLCVVGLADGRVLIKVLKPARGGRFHLFPNAAGEPILDAKVTWAALVIHMEPKGRRR
jgi:hypothetical protein